MLIMFMPGVWEAPLIYPMPRPFARAAASGKEMKSWLELTLHREESYSACGKSKL
jgi:hypothetical protein